MLSNGNCCLSDSIYFVEDERINIEIKIVEGPKYYFRDIDWVGNSKYTSEVLNAILGIKKGDIFDQSILDNKNSELGLKDKTIKQQKKEIRKQKFLKIVGFTGSIILPILTLIALL